MFLNPLPAQNVYAVEKPVIESFTASKTDVDLTDRDLSINFELVVSHPSGIENTFTTLNLTNSGSFSISTQLKRMEDPADFLLKKVAFRGELIIPRSLKPGVYTYSVSGVTSGAEKINSASSLTIAKVDTGIIIGPVLRALKNAESGILIRSNGYLDLNYQTINGPAYGPQSGLAYIDNSKYSNVTAPVWKVGEVINMSDYFELAVSSAELLVNSTTPKICLPNGVLLKLLTLGDCSFTVSTDRSKDYLSKMIYQSQSITEGRKPSILFIEKIANLQARNLPITLELPKVYSSGMSSVEYVIPKSITPEICETGGYILKIISGGSCLLTYQSPGNSNYLPSETYTQTILIEKQPQTIAFQPVQTVDVKNKTLDLMATASGKGTILYSTTSTGICSITGSTLSLIKAGNCSVTATAAGTNILTPISATINILLIGTTAADKKIINCIKGKNIKKIIGIKLKCPAGYKTVKKLTKNS